MGNSDILVYDNQSLELVDTIKKRDVMSKGEIRKMIVVEGRYLIYSMGNNLGTITIWDTNENKEVLWLNFEDTREKLIRGLFWNEDNNIVVLT